MRTATLFMVCLMASTNAISIVGRQLRGRQLAEAEATTACTNAADQAIFDGKGKTSFVDDMTRCGKSCWGSSDCVAKCIVKKRGYTEKCSKCYGELGSCTLGNCLSKCIWGNSPSCGQCQQDACVPAFEKCSGVNPPAPEDSRMLKEAGNIPVATYHGKAEKGVGCFFGTCLTNVKVDATAIANADSTLNIKVKAQGNLPVDLDCPNEPYTLGADGAIKLLNYPKTAASKGDCIEKALPAGINLKTLKYNGEGKSIDMSVSAPLGINIDITADVQDSRMLKEAGNIPVATYSGKAKQGIGCFFGTCLTTVKVDATAIANADSTLNIKVKATGNLPVDLDCPNEPYTLGADGAIKLLNYPKTAASKGDCIEKALPAGINLKTLKYDGEGKSIDMSVSAPLGINIDITADVQE